MPAPTPEDIKGYALQLLRSGSKPREAHAAVLDRFRDRPAEQLPSERTIENWGTSDRKKQKDAQTPAPPLAPQTLPPREPIPLTADGAIDVPQAYAQRIRHDLRLAAAVHEVLVAWVERVSRAEDHKLNGTELQQLTSILTNTRTSAATYVKAEQEKPAEDPATAYLRQLSVDVLKRLVAGEAIPIDELPEGLPA